MLSGQQIARIVVMRGLGYSQEEIADEFDITQGAVSYNLKQLRMKAREHGLEEAYLRVLAAGGGIESLRPSRLA
jgi:predicted transcriptional regulator